MTAAEILNEVIKFLIIPLITILSVIGIVAFATHTKWSCDPPVSIGYLTSIKRNPERALITLDNGREFVVLGYPDVTLPGLNYMKGDEVFKSSCGAAGNVSFGDKGYWYQVLH